MTLQNPEETAERGITRYTTLGELLWSQWNDVFLSSKEKNWKSGGLHTDMTSEALVLRWRVEPNSDDCASVLFQTNIHSLLIIRHTEVPKMLLMTAQWQHLSHLLDISCSSPLNMNILTQINKQSVVDFIFSIFSRFCYKLGVGSWVHVSACRGRIQILCTA